MDAVFERVSRERIYEITGVQFLPFNTLFQLYATCRTTPGLIEQSEFLLTIPDLLNYWLTGSPRGIYDRDYDAVGRREDAQLVDPDDGRTGFAVAAVPPDRAAGE